MPGDWFRSLAALLVFLQPAWACPNLRQDGTAADAELLATIKTLYQSGQWEAVTRQISAASSDSAELDYYKGMALAHLQRWQDANRAFERGERKVPTDKRFPLERAGALFKMGSSASAKACLRRALKLDPQDSYGREFLASLYFLEGNLEAAVQHWNQLGKPAIDEIKMTPLPQLRPDLLDRAFAFAPASLLNVGELRTTQAQLDLLEIYPRYRFELLPRKDGVFDLLFTPTEKNGWGDNRFEALLSLLKGLPYQTVYPEFYNLGKSSLNSLSLVRWDAQKRRFLTCFSGPLGGNPHWRYRFSLDGRKENWDLSRSFQGATSANGDLRMQKQSVGAEILNQWKDRLRWRSAVDVTHRIFQNPPVVDGNDQLFPHGTSIKYQTGIDSVLARVPEHRLTTLAFAGLDFGRMLVIPRTTFAKYQVGARTQWLPQARGDDYAVNAQFRSGTIQGNPPFDELFMLGIERDNNLWMRAHVGTRDGKKGNSPLGRSYVLFNGEVDKILYRHAFFDIKLGPFLDSGKIFDKTGFFGSREWLWDVGAQAKFRVLEGTTFIFSYGKDLQTGGNAVYFTVSR